MLFKPNFHTASGIEGADVPSLFKRGKKGELD